MDGDNDEDNQKEENEEPLHKKQKLMIVNNNNDINLKRLPQSEMYEWSWMHRKTISNIGMASNYDFLITTSNDGVIKFWKKTQIGIEFVKEYRGHNDYIQCMDISLDGTLLITVGNDKNCCIFDVVTFDMITRLSLSYFAGCCCWINNTLKRNTAMIAISEKHNSRIHIYKPMTTNDKSIHDIENIHRLNTKILCMKYNKKYDCCVSTDLLGNVEYWSTQSPFDRPNNLSFEYIMDTDLFVYKKNKIIPTSITISNNSELIVIKSSDNFIRLFRFKTGKLLLKLNENIEEYQNSNDSIYGIDSIEFGKHIAVERQLNKEMNESIFNNNKKWLCNNIIFDESDNFLLYSTMMGIKVIDIVNDGQLIKLIGKQETNVRFLNISLFQGIANTKIGHSRAQKLGTNDIIGTSMNNTLNKMESDPSIFVTGYNKDRFYMFTNRSNESDGHRDIQNNNTCNTSYISQNSNCSNNIW